MAELVLKIGAGSGYADGDILDAFTPRRIRCVHAEHLCHVQQAGLTSDGLRPMTSLAWHWHETVCGYRFERVSKTEINRVDLATGMRQRFDETPRFVDGRLQHIHVAEFLARQVLHPLHRIFGVRGAEVWHGGIEDRSDPALGIVWTKIETHSAHRRDDAAFARFPLGTQDVISHLPIATDDFDDAEADVLRESAYDASEQAQLVHKRRHYVTIDAVLGLSASDLAKARHRTQSYDDRGRMRHDLKVIVSRKL